MENTIKAENGYKTRDFEAILGEVNSFSKFIKLKGSYAGGSP